MRKATFKYIESELYHYYENMKMIEEIENNAIYCKNGNDENIGGGKSTVVVSQIENTVIKLNSNKKLQTIKEHVDIITKCYESYSEPYQKLMHMKYWSNKKYTWEGIANRLYVHRATAFRMRNKIIEDIADKMGVV